MLDTGLDLGEKALVGYAENREFYVENSAEQIAAFIMAHQYEDVTLVDVLDRNVLNTSMGFVQYCYDQRFLREELIPVLAPMQMGEAEIIEFVEVELDEKS
jgi:hypothetical protein